MGEPERGPGVHTRRILAERVAMAQWWRDHLDTLRKGVDVGLIFRMDR